jgi:hypothetical protein
MWSVDAPDRIKKCIEQASGGRYKKGSRVYLTKIQCPIVIAPPARMFPHVRGTRPS